MRFQKITLFLTALVVLFTTACSSEYHWIKVKSGDPQWIKKVDEKSKNLLNPSVENPAPILKTENLESKSAHGLASIQAETVFQKSREIEKNLDENRKMDLKSDNKGVQKQAIQKTLHEELVKNSAFAKLSSAKQVKLETQLTHKISKHARAYGGRGVNALLVLGLILLLVSLLLINSGTIAVIGVLFSVILIILGLVQGIL